MALPEPSAEQRGCIAALVEDGANVVIQAQAGAGKSTTFFHIARAWLAAHPAGRIVLLCFNVNLRTASEARVEAIPELRDRVDCFTIHSLASRMYGVPIGDTMTLQRYLASDHERAAPNEYDLCLIDEGQDLSGSMVGVIRELQRLTPMRLAVVGDRRQAIYTFSREVELEVLDRPGECLLPNDAAWTERTLDESYRLTPPVAACLNALFRHPADAPIVAANARSAAVRPRYVVGDLAAGGLLLTLVEEMLLLYPPDQIMVLAPSVRGEGHGCRELARALSEHRRIPLFTTHKRLSEVNPELLRGKLVVSTYHQSKGDERDCVIVVGVDGRLHRQRGYPMRDGVAVVDNALHVALTRARERLIIVQSCHHEPYPSVRQRLLALHCDVHHAAEYQPKDLPPLTLCAIRRPVSWLTEFASEETLEALGRLLQLDAPVRLGDPVPRAPPATVRVGASLEDVADYYPAAIVAAADRERKMDVTRSPRSLSTLEEKLRSRARRKHLRQMPPVYAAFYERYLDANAAPAGPRAWLQLSVLHQAFAGHGYRHELQQVRHFDWVDAEAAAYFRGCVDNLLRLTRRHAHSEFFQETRREHAELKTAVVGAVDYVGTSDGGGYMPWRLSFSDEPTETDYLTLAVCMWTMFTRHGNVYCVPSNTMHKVHFETDEALERFIARIIALKRSVVRDAERDMAEALAAFGEAMGGE